MAAEKLNSNNIPTRTPLLTDLFYFAGPSNGLGAKNTLAVLKNLMTAAGSTPCQEFNTIADLLANTTMLQDYFAFVLDASGDPDVGTGTALYLYNGGDPSLLNSYYLIKGGTENVFNIDGGTPDSIYTSIPDLDGGGV